MYSFFRLLALSVVLLVCTSATDPVAPGYVFDLDKADLTELVALELQAGNEEVDGTEYDLAPRSDEIASRHFKRNVSNQAPMYVSYYYRKRDSSIRSITYVQNYDRDPIADCGRCKYGSYRYNRAVTAAGWNLAKLLKKRFGQQDRGLPDYSFYDMDFRHLAGRKFQWSTPSTDIRLRYAADFHESAREREECTDCRFVRLMVSRPISAKQVEYVRSQRDDVQIAHIKNLISAMYQRDYDKAATYLPASYADSDKVNMLVRYANPLNWNQELKELRYEVFYNERSDLIFHWSLRIGDADSAESHMIYFNFNEQNEVLAFYGNPR